MEFIIEFGLIAGLAGIALGVFLYLFREVIRIKILSKLTKKQSFIILIIFMVSVFLISVISIVIYYDDKSNLQLTIFVVDTNGNVVLENEGRLNIPLGNRTLNELIGANGRTNFSDITSENEGDTILIGLVARGWEIAGGNNTFVFTGDPIRLVVKRNDSLGIIKGVVKSLDGQEFIIGALIRINTDATVFSDSLGHFKIILPMEMRVTKETDRYLLTVSKEGYKTVTQYHSPMSSAAQIRLEKEQ